MTETTDFGEYRNEDKPDTNLTIYNYEETVKKEEESIAFNEERNLE